MAEPGVGRRRSRSFGPAVLGGLAGATLAAVAGSRDWARSSGDAAGIKVDAAVTGSETAPLVTALALLALAAWGVVLVTRGWVRRAVAVVGALAGSGMIAAVVLGVLRAQDDALEALRGTTNVGDVSSTTWTAWPFVAGVGALLALVAFLAAVRFAPSWPAMGTRYDAPGAQADVPASDQDMWRALDEGRDPTK